MYVWLRNRRRIRVTDSSTSREAAVAMGGAHSSEEDGRWGPKVLEWQPRTGKCSVCRSPTRWTTLGVSQVAAGFKRLSVDIMMYV
ncbi:jg5825 [Pararge aegeria aegeria]|uniref:Jg5825 protein n=1 Tax=Pararge aegeria aegeria TaxID=348720 RepID=A0A8S4RA65_9NEOP|nr:jg5825 [Pararge aegeria aegeria]